MEKATNGPANYKNKENLFVITLSKNGECFIVTAPMKTAWEVIYKLLKEQYTFQFNGNGNLTTTTSTEGQKVVLTLYNNSHKLLIQGLGCKFWKDTVFKELSRKVNSEITNSQTNLAATGIEQSPDKQCDEMIPNSQPLKPKAAGNISPGNIFSKLFSMKKTPKPGKTPVNYMQLTKEQQYEYVRQQTPKYWLSSPRNYSPVHKNSIKDTDKVFKCDQNTNEDVIPTSIDGAPIGKDLQDLTNETVDYLSLSETESVSFTDNTNQEETECIEHNNQVEGPAQEINEYRHKLETVTQEKKDMNCIKELEMCRNELSTIKKENKELQFKEFLTQSKLLRAENEKLI